MIRHIVILQFKKIPDINFLELLEKTRPYIQDIPGLLEYKIMQNDSTYTPKANISLAVEIIFSDQKALDLFMMHPNHYKANDLFIKYLADPPFMVLTHQL
jgi:hypothetical protein